MKIAVTGGTGYLGGRLVQRLGGPAGVTVLSRKSGHDIRRLETLREPMAGVETVFHLAALVQSRPGPFEQTNIDGLRNVFQAAMEAGVRRLVCVSSFTVFGPSQGRPHTEEAAGETRERFFHGYDHTKYAGYRTALKWRGKIPLNIVFPTVIYGPGAMTEGNITARMFRRWHRLRMAALPGGGRPSWNFVHVDDVADGLVRTLSADPGEDFILGGEDITLKGLSRLFAQVSGRRIAALGLPDPVFKAGAWMEDLASRIAGFPPLVLPATADFFVNDWEFSSAKAKAELGYRPRSLESGLRETFRWMTESGTI